MNERITERGARKLLEAAGYERIEEQQSKTKTISDLLSAASKTGRGGVGFPEFIARIPGRRDLLVVVECKADERKHGGGADGREVTAAKPADLAVDGALHYAKALSKRYTVLAVAASGQDEDALKLSFYLHRKGAGEPVAATLSDGSHYPAMPTPEEVERLVDGPASRSTVEELRKVAAGIHEHMRNYGALKQDVKPLVVAGSLIALRHKPFRDGYRGIDENDGEQAEHGIPPEFGESWIKAISSALASSSVPAAKTASVVDQFRHVIATSPAILSRNNRIRRGSKKVVEERSVLAAIVEELDDRVFPEMDHQQGYDLVGDFYGEFLRYATGDGKDLGIVLTPSHVTELFALLADVSKDSVVLDPCTGTGGFLIAAMEKMSDPARNGGTALTPDEIDAIKSRGLMGVEFQPQMFALAASNMLLRGDGKANLFLGSCFDDEIAGQLVDGTRDGSSTRMPRPDVGIVNPPYSQGKKDPDLCEAAFILRLLDTVAPGGTVVAIVPMSTATGWDEWRAKILAKHTLEASMTMPPELFYGVGVQTVTLVFTAGKAHPAAKRTWFARWVDDGHITLRGRKDLKGRWPAIRDQWVADFQSRKPDTPGYCVSRHVGPTDEWLVEAHMETDYSNLADEDFIRVLREFAVYRMSVLPVDEALDICSAVAAGKAGATTPRPPVDEWAEFRFDSLFEIARGERIVASRQSPGETAYVGGSGENNGVTGRYAIEPQHEAGAITVSYNGTVGYATVQPEPFHASDDVYILEPKAEVGPAGRLFLCALIRREAEKFGYGRKWKLDRMRASTLRLPVEADGEPDWAAIEAYVLGLPWSGAIPTGEDRADA